MFKNIEREDGVKWPTFRDQLLDEILVLEIPKVGRVDLAHLSVHLVRYYEMSGSALALQLGA